MSVPSSVEELVELIRKSGMVDEQALATYLHGEEARGGPPADPRDAAEAMVRDGLLTDFQREQYLLGKWRGFTIGKYKLLERIGVGGMGQVFLCEHMFMKRRVALKVLPPAKADQPAALGRFYREARAAGALEHPHIVRTHDIDQDGNLHFIVMEFVDGTNLLDVVKRFGPLDVRRATSYVRQVALGLDFAFRSGLIHRDIKPGNVLIDRHGHAKLLDLGLARFFNDHTDMLTVKYDDKVVLGTADYVAPEQVANSHDVDIRADVYALGASFYFLLAGQPPFPSGTVSQKLLWHRTKDPTPIRLVRPEVPEELAAVVAKMMRKDPAQRYQTPVEVAIELERWVPADVPLPAEEEMPRLCLAAQADGVEVALTAEPKAGSKALPVPAAPLSELRSRSMAKPSPFAPPGGVARAPEPFVPLAVAAAKPPSRIGQPNPFAIALATDTQQAPRPDDTPEPFAAPAARPQRPAFPDRFLATAAPAADTAPHGRALLFYALLWASGVVATVVILLKLFLAAPKG